MANLMVQSQVDAVKNGLDWVQSKYFGDGQAETDQNPH